MAIRWTRLETWLTLFVAGVGAILLFVSGLWVYMSAMAKPIHPVAQDMSVNGVAPLPPFADAVKQAEQIARDVVAERNLPGVSIAVGVDDRIVWAAGFGWADIDKKTPVTPTTRFRLGTLSIPLTATAAAWLVEKKQLNLDEKIETYVPEFPEKKWPVTVRQVMAHTAGLPTDSGDEGPLFGKHCDRPVEAFPEFANRELRFEPGTDYYYSRYGFILISAAIEKVADQSLLAFMQTQLFDRLGMNDTTADSTPEPVSPDRATSYFPKFASDPRYGPDQNRPLDFSCYSGASMFVSTASDLARFALAINGGKLLQPETVQLLETSQRLPSGQETGYGLGWDLENVTLNGTNAISEGHDGEILGGISATMMTFRDRGLVVVVLTNVSYSDAPSLALKIADVFAAR